MRTPRSSARKPEITRPRICPRKITDASGGDIAVSVVPQIYERDYAAVVPTAPLAPGSRFRVRLELSVGGNDIVEEWEFETER